MPLTCSNVLIKEHKNIPYTPYSLVMIYHQEWKKSVLFSVSNERFQLDSSFSAILWKSLWNLLKCIRMYYANNTASTKSTLSIVDRLTEWSLYISVTLILRWVVNITDAMKIMNKTCPWQAEFPWKYVIAQLVIYWSRWKRRLVLPVLVLKYWVKIKILPVVTQLIF